MKKIPKNFKLGGKKLSKKWVAFKALLKFHRIVRVDPSISTILFTKVLPLRRSEEEFKALILEIHVSEFFFSKQRNIQSKYYEIN